MTIQQEFSMWFLGTAILSNVTDGWSATFWTWFALIMAVVMVVSAVKEIWPTN